MTVYYKAFAKLDKNLMASCVLSRACPYSTVYQHGVWSEAEIGGLLVFESLFYLEEFVFALPVTVRVFEVLVLDEIALPRYRLSTVDFDRQATDIKDTMKTLWKQGEIKNITVSQGLGWPPGTKAFKFIKPIEEIDV